MPGLMTRTSLMPLRDSSSLQAIVLRTIDRDEPDGIARLEQKRLRAERFERTERGPADQLPSTRRVRRIHAGLKAGDPHRTGRHADAGHRMTGRGDSRIDRAHVRKSRKKTEHEHTVRHGCVESD